MLEIGEILTRLGSQNSIEANLPDQVNWQFPLFLKFLEQKRMVMSICEWVKYGEIFTIFSEFQRKFHYLSSTPTLNFGHLDKLCVFIMRFLKTDQAKKSQFSIFSVISMSYLTSLLACEYLWGKNEILFTFMCQAFPGLGPYRVISGYYHQGR